MTIWDFSKVGWLYVILPLKLSILFLIIDLIKSQITKRSPGHPNNFSDEIMFTFYSRLVGLDLLVFINIRLPTLATRKFTRARRWKFLGSLVTAREIIATLYYFYLFPFQLSFIIVTKCARCIVMAHLLLCETTTSETLN